MRVDKLGCEAAEEVVVVEVVEAEAEVVAEAEATTTERGAPTSSPPVRHMQLKIPDSKMSVAQSLTSSRTTELLCIKSMSARLHLQLRWDLGLLSGLRLRRSGLSESLERG